MQDALLAIQQNLNAPKNLRNNFGGYNYRSAESILEALKPLLSEHKLTIRISDELVNVGERYYVKATVTITDGKEYIETVAYAREEETKKGMDGSQITGASSSYARKYALNGMFAIDDSADSDTTNDHGKSAQPEVTNFIDVQKKIKSAKNLEDLMKLYNALEPTWQSAAKAAFTARKVELNGTSKDRAVATTKTR